MAITRADYAYMLAERGAGDDLTRADELVGEALRVGGDLGMASLVERAFALKSAPPGDRVRRRRAPRSTRSRPWWRTSARTSAAHTAPDGTVTILFSDIEGSTEMTERLGDRRWIEVLREHNAHRPRQRRGLHGGFEVKSQGDGFMIAFASAAAAASSARSRSSARSPARAEERPDEPIRVRIGLHTGEAIRERDDFFGRNVILAARIAAQARGGEVLVSVAAQGARGRRRGRASSASRASSS